MQAELLDLELIGVHLQRHVDGFSGLTSIKKFADGQSNPSYLLEADSGQYVLRKQPPGKLLKSAHAVNREFHVIKQLAQTNVPVPDAIYLCEDTSLIGTLFYIMSYEQGRIFWDPALPELDAQQRGKIYAEMSHTLAALHDINVDDVGLAEFGRPGNYFARQIRIWSQQYKASETQKIQAMDYLIQWLPHNIPADDGQFGLIHGDFRLDNIIFHPGENRVKAVLDWELSTLGHPYADLAYQCMQLRLDNNAVIKGLGGVDRNKAGLPSEQVYLNNYCRVRGLDSIADWKFFLVFSFFRFAAILQGVRKRAIDGNASSEIAMEYGALTPTLAKMAIEIIN